MENYCVYKFYYKYVSFKHNNLVMGNHVEKADLNFKTFLQFNFVEGPYKAFGVCLEADKYGVKIQPALFEIFAFFLPTAAAIAGAATAGVLFLKPVIEQAIVNAMADAAAAEVLKQVASIATIAIGSAVIGVTVGLGVKNAVAAIIVAAREADEAKGK